METKVQLLAQKIYEDGVEKANVEAQAILSEAEAKRDALLREAQNKAEQIVAQAKQSEANTRQQMEQDLRNLVGNATDALQASITNMITYRAVERGVDEAFASPKSIFKLIVKLSEEMISQDASGVEISGAEAKELEAYFEKEAKELLSKGVTIREVAGRAASFDIAPSGADFKINVSKEAFAEYFKEFMRPRMQELLFGGSQEA